MNTRIPPILFWGREVNPVLAAFIVLILLCVCCFPVFLSSIIPGSARATPISDEPVPAEKPSVSRTQLPTTTPTALDVTPTPTACPTSQKSITPATTRSQTIASRPLPSLTPTRVASTATRLTIGSCPQGCTVPPTGCSIKGNISSSGEKIYHVLGGASYNQTEIDPGKGERWFCTETEAVASGWRKSQR